MPAQPLIGQNQAGEVKTEWPTPLPADEMLVALLESKIEDYVAIQMGSPPPQGSHPDQLLTQQIPIDWAHVQRTYAKDRTAQQVYNYSISYDAEGNAFPTFIRDYVVRRYGYAPLTKGTALAGFISAKVVAGGTGYTQETVSNLTSNGSVVVPVISNGAVVHLAITTEGSATSDVSGVSITGTVGSGASADLKVQPQTAVLTKEDFLRTPDSPLDGLWVIVRRVYTTLQGATLTEKKYDLKTNTVVTVSKTRKLTSVIVPEASVITVGSDNFVRIVDLEPIDNLTSYEVITLQPQPSAHDLSTAFITHVDFNPFEFPATLDVSLYQTTNGVLGYNPAFVRRVKQETWTYWVVDDTAPNIDAIMSDSMVGGIIFPGSIFGLIRTGGNLGLGTLSEIIYNAVNLAYGTTVIDWPDSTPNFANYVTDWVGTNAMPTGARFWRGEVSPEGNYFRWRVDLTNVQYMLPAQGTVEP